MHTECRSKHAIKCPLGSNRLSVVPPTAIHSVGKIEFVINLLYLIIIKII